MKLDRETVFCDEYRAETARRVRKILKEALQESGASDVGILRNGGKRSKKARCFALGILFRNPDPKVMTGNRNLRVGRKEVILEFKPGEIPPAFLKMRIIRGADVPNGIRKSIAEIFLELKSEGYFLEDYARSIAELVKRIVQAHRDDCQ